MSTNNAFKLDTNDLREMFKTFILSTNSFNDLIPTAKTLDVINIWKKRGIPITLDIVRFVANLKDYSPIIPKETKEDRLWRAFQKNFEEYFKL